MVDVERKFVADMYPSEKWKFKVAKMSDAQVLAIYFRQKNKEVRQPPEEESPDEPIPF